MKVIYNMWQVPSSCHLLWLLQSSLKIKSYTIQEIEVINHEKLFKLISLIFFLWQLALLSPEFSIVAEEIFTKLLLRDKKDRDRFGVGLGI